MHILLTIPEHGVSIQLTGTVSAQTVVLTAPTSRMKDEDIQTLVQIRDTIQSVLQFVQTAANSVQNALIFPQTSKARNGSSRFWLLFCHFTGRGFGHRWRR